MRGFQTFDESSGQVFSEWSASSEEMTGKTDNGWIRRKSHPPRNQGKRLRSLHDLAMDVVLLNIGYMTKEHLAALPSHLLLRIWRALEKEGPCFQSWKLLSPLLLPQTGRTLGLYHFRRHIPEPGTNLRCYTQPMTSLSFEFMTHIVIADGCRFSVADMLCLANVKNLGILEIIAPQSSGSASGFPQVTDRLVRGWTEADDPFPLLRALRIWGGELLTPVSLQWVSKLPSLVMYDVMGSRRTGKAWEHRARQSGWQCTVDTCGYEGALVRQMSLLISDESRARKLRDMAERVKRRLAAAYNKLDCAVDFIDPGRAPWLLYYLASLRESPGEGEAGRTYATCAAPLEARGFWLYSLIGQLTNDGDLKRRGVEVQRQAVAGPLVLPARPMAYLWLGQGDQKGSRCWRTYSGSTAHSMNHFTFTRLGNGGLAQQTVRRSDAEKPVPCLGKRKRTNMQDLLQSFSTK